MIHGLVIAVLFVASVVFVRRFLLVYGTDDCRWTCAFADAFNIVEEEFPEHRRLLEISASSRGRGFCPDCSSEAIYRDRIRHMVVCPDCGSEKTYEEACLRALRTAVLERESDRSIRLRLKEQ